MSQWAGQLFRFVHNAHDGDLVVYRQTGGGPINVGRLKGPYVHDASVVYTQRRPVGWLATELSPSGFPPGALYALGAYLTPFRLRRYDEVWTAAAGDIVPAPTINGSDNESAETGTEALEQLDATAIAQATRDFIARRISKHFKGHGFAPLTAHILELRGYTTSVSPPGKDYGVDIVARRGPLGLEPPIIKVQVKSSDSKVGSQPVAELFGRLAQSGEAGLFVTLGQFTADAQTFARDCSNLRLIDGAGFVDLIIEHYDELAEEYTARFPLSRVWARSLAAEAGDPGP